MATAWGTVCGRRYAGLRRSASLHSFPVGNQTPDHGADRSPAGPCAEQQCSPWTATFLPFRRREACAQCNQLQLFEMLIATRWRRHPNARSSPIRGPRPSLRANPNRDPSPSPRRDPSPSPGGDPSPSLRANPSRDDASPSRRHASSSRDRPSRHANPARCPKREPSRDRPKQQGWRAQRQ
jgi:hypothetical protein